MVIKELTLALTLDSCCFTVFAKSDFHPPAMSIENDPTYWKIEKSHQWRKGYCGKNSNFICTNSTYSMFMYHAISCYIIWPFWPHPDCSAVLVVRGKFEPYSSKFSRAKIVVIFVKLRWITKILSMEISSPMGVPTRSALLDQQWITKIIIWKKLNHESFIPQKFGAIRYNLQNF